MSFRIGKCVASHPWQTIIGAWTLVALCSLGFFRFYNERDPLKLWVPKGNSKACHLREVDKPGWCLLMSVSSLYFKERYYY